jgi:hypothetical protein
MASSTYALGVAICEAAGLDANKITALNLRFRSNGQATLTVRQVVESKDGLDAVFRRFNLNPIEKIVPVAVGQDGGS